MQRTDFWAILPVRPKPQPRKGHREVVVILGGRPTERQDARFFMPKAFS